MTLEMRAACERCGQALDAAGEAYICTFECTFCGDVHGFDGRRLPELRRRARPPATAAGRPGRLDRAFGQELPEGRILAELPHRDQRVARLDRHRPAGHR